MAHQHRLPHVTTLALLALGSLASPARADLVTLTSGRTMSVRGHRVDGDQMTLQLRDGGEVSFPAALVARVDPDEVPYPDPPAVAVNGTQPAAGTFVALTGPYDDLIRKAALRYGVDPSLVHAVIRAESNYAATARSWRGARGLMQLMPQTLRTYQVRNGFDPTANIDAGTRHLRTLLDRYPLAQALAAYNAGEAAVLRYGGIPPFPETRSYVARILAAVTPAAP